MSNGPLNFLIVLGSVRRDRVGIRLARYLERSITERGETSTLLDPMVLDLPLLDRMYKEHDKGTAPAGMEEAADRITASDAVIVVSAEYNHGIPPALVNLLDHFLEEWFHKPAGIATYSVGRFGGVRAALPLRVTLGELGMPTVSTLLAVPDIAGALRSDGTPAADWLHPSMTQFLDELDWWARAAKSRMAEHGPPFGETS